MLAYLYIYIYMCGVGGMGEATKSAALCKSHSSAGVSGDSEGLWSLPPHIHCSSPSSQFLCTIPLKSYLEKGQLTASQLLCRAAHALQIAKRAETHAGASPGGAHCSYTCSPEGLAPCRWDSPGPAKSMEIQCKSITGSIQATHGVR